jgi:outer membrane murein-binding lipoprotein Lpp
MKFENEFVNLVTSDTQLEQMYKNSFDKLNTELKDLQAKVDKLKKQEDEALVKAQAGFDESVRWIKEFDCS